MLTNQKNRLLQGLKAPYGIHWLSKYNKSNYCKSMNNGPKNGLFDDVNQAPDFCTALAAVALTPEALAALSGEEESC